MLYGYVFLDQLYLKYAVSCQTYLKALHVTYKKINPLLLDRNNLSVPKHMLKKEVKAKGEILKIVFLTFL